MVKDYRHDDKKVGLWANFPYGGREKVKAESSSVLKLLSAGSRRSHNSHTSDAVQPPLFVACVSIDLRGATSRLFLLASSDMYRLETNEWDQQSGVQGGRPEQGQGTRLEDSALRGPTRICHCRGQVQARDQQLQFNLGSEREVLRALVMLVRGTR